jgi:hypothetical protein
MHLAIEWLIVERSLLRLILTHQMHLLLTSVFNIYACANIYARATLRMTD